MNQLNSQQGANMTQPTESEPYQGIKANSVKSVVSPLKEEYSVFQTGPVRGRGTSGMFGEIACAM